jgi:cation/acetate symporter
VNGVAFAGDYLSAASFLGICGMIAFYGYDGFLYSIGYLAGWIVALLVIAEPLKRLGKFTFADALDSQFNSRGIKLAAAISTLVVSVFYLIPQMVGTGALVKPLLGLSHEVGVIIVGVAVILIVVTAGMVSTTWVQFIKGGLLVVFCAILTGMILARGLAVPQEQPDGSLQLHGRIIPMQPLPVSYVKELPDGKDATGPLNPLSYLATIQNSTVMLQRAENTASEDGSARTVYHPKPTPGKDLLTPGGSPTFAAIRKPWFVTKDQHEVLDWSAVCPRRRRP